MKVLKQGPADFQWSCLSGCSSCGAQLQVGEADLYLTNGTATFRCGSCRAENSLSADTLPKRVAKDVAPNESQMKERKNSGDFA